VDEDASNDRGEAQRLGSPDLVWLLCFIADGLLAIRMPTREYTRRPVPFAVFLDKPVLNNFSADRMDFARARGNVINQDRC